MVMFSGMPIAFSLGAVAVRLHVLLHAGVVARHGHPERLRGNGEHHPAVDPAVHPQGRGDRQVPRRQGSVSGDPRLDAAHPRRTGHRQCLRLCAVRGDGGVEPGDLLGHRQRRHSGDAQARLFAGLRGRHHRRGRHARHPAPAVDHDDPLRRRGRAVARHGCSSPASARACCSSRCSPPTHRIAYRAKSGRRRWRSTPPASARPISRT